MKDKSKEHINSAKTTNTKFPFALLLLNYRRELEPLDFNTSSIQYSPNNTQITS